MQFYQRSCSCNITYFQFLQMYFELQKKHAVCVAVVFLSILACLYFSPPANYRLPNHGTLLWLQLPVMASRLVFCGYAGGITNNQRQVHAQRKLSSPDEWTIDDLQWRTVPTHWSRCFFKKKKQYVTVVTYRQSQSVQCVIGSIDF